MVGREKVGREKVGREYVVCDSDNSQFSKNVS